MLPDFSKPAFDVVALCTVRFRDRDDGAPRAVVSDLRCQLRYAPDATGDVEVRVYLVGQAQAASREEVPAVLAFLDPESQRKRCCAGTAFELRAGSVPLAEGTVHAVALRDAGSAPGDRDGARDC